MLSSAVSVGGGVLSNDWDRKYLWEKTTVELILYFQVDI